MSYADVCSRVLTYAHVCPRMLTYGAGVDKKHARCRRRPSDTLLILYSYFTYNLIQESTKNMRAVAEGLLTFTSNLPASVLECLSVDSPKVCVCVCVCVCVSECLSFSSPQVRVSVFVYLSD